MIVDYKAGDPPPPDKPQWADVPDWVGSIGVAAWDCDYKGEWCYCAGDAPDYFDHVEKRPSYGK